MNKAFIQMCYAMHARCGMINEIHRNCKQWTHLTKARVKCLHFPMKKTMAGKLWPLVEKNVCMHSDNNETSDGSRGHILVPFLATKMTVNMAYS
jgi:hypothetical protein